MGAAAGAPFLASRAASSLDAAVGAPFLTSRAASSLGAAAGAPFLARTAAPSLAAEPAGPASFLANRVAASLAAEPADADPSLAAERPAEAPSLAARPVATGSPSVPTSASSSSMFLSTMPLCRWIEGDGRLQGWQRTGGRTPRARAHAARAARVALAAGERHLQLGSDSELDDGERLPGTGSIDGVRLPASAQQLRAAGGAQQDPSTIPL
jgi:hypothetical protein